MTDHHTESERHAAEAQLAAHRGETDRARELYALAARAESKALLGLDQSKLRTLGVTALSAAALWYKAAKFEEAETLVHTWLGSRKLPPFATDGLREILEHIWSVQALEPQSAAERAEAITEMAMLKHREAEMHVEGVGVMLRAEGYELRAATELWRQAVIEGEWEFRDF